MEESRKFLLTNNKSKILQKLKNNYNLVFKKKHTAMLSYYDTFNAKLFLKNYFLINNNSINKYLLYDFKKNIIVCEDDTENRIKYSHDFANPEMKTQLKEIVKERILWELLKTLKTIEEYIIENNEQKRIIKLSFERNNIILDDKKKSAGSYIIITKLRGYEKEYNNISAFLTNENLQAAVESLLLAGLKKLKHPSVFYFSKSGYKINKKTSVYNSTKLILSHYLKKLILNEPGIIKDEDIEYLHEYRVTLRLIRSFIPVLNVLYNKELIKKIKNDFRLIAKTTNLMRDIDVFLSNLEKYKKHLDEKYLKLIDSFSEYLIKKRKDEYNKIKIFLNSDRYKNIISGLKKIILIKNNKGLENQEIFVIVKNQLSILKEKIFICRNKINYISIENQMHKLRICFKKLRYLLTIFKEIIPEDILSPLYTDLKKIQDALGEQNDLQVQEKLLNTYSQINTNKKINISELISYLNSKRNLLFKKNLELLNKTMNNKNFKRLYLFINI